MSWAVQHVNIVLAGKLAAVAVARNEIYSHQPISASLRLPLPTISKSQTNRIHFLEILVPTSVRR